MNGQDIARHRQNLASGVGTTTRRNRVLPAARRPTDIPERIGKAGPREEAGAYIEVDYSYRVLDTQNAPTYQLEMLNTGLDGPMTLYLQPRPLDTPAGDAYYFASAVKLTTTDGLLKTDYQNALKEAMIRPSAGADRIAGFVAAPVSAWFANYDLVRGPTGVHALVRKPKTVDMVVDGSSEKLTLKPPPYTTPAGTGICPLDEIIKLGDPWHGLIQGGVVRLPNGGTRTVARPGIGTGSVYPLIPHGVVPASTADAADVAAGRTWLNYGLLAGSCLYEQTLSSAFPAWVYIDPDNSTWRVEYAHVYQAGVWHMQLKFYPLRRVFLTADKWGGLVQTTLTPINPTTTTYSNGALYDLDSKGANAVFFQTSTAIKGAALVTITGIPPAAAVTNTLLCDGSIAPSPYAMSYYETPTIVQDDRQWHYRTFTVDYSSVPYVETYGGVVDYLQGHNDPAPGDFLPPFPPVVDQWPVVTTWQIGWSTYKYQSTGGSVTVVGYCFDKNDDLKEVKTYNGTAYGQLDTAETPTFQGSNFWQMNPGFVRTGIPQTLKNKCMIGSIDSPSVDWDFDGLSVLTATPNKYGPASVGGNPVSVQTVRYSNRVYGLKVSIPGQYEEYYLPPMSPEGQSIYIADILSNVKPFGTYHPITGALTWEAGFVNYV